jgi:hypothetical protein
MQTQTVNANTDPGKTCHLDVDVTTCTLTGTGRVAYIGSGWVWFNFNDRVSSFFFFCRITHELFAPD